MWCATGVNLSGGVTKDGGAIFGASVFYNNNDIEEKVNIDTEHTTTIDESIEMKKLDEELKVVFFFSVSIIIVIANSLYYFRITVDRI